MSDAKPPIHLRMTGYEVVLAVVVVAALFAAVFLPPAWFVGVYTLCAAVAVVVAIRVINRAFQERE